MSEAKRPDPKRRSPAARPGRAGRPRKAPAARRGAGQPRSEPAAASIKRSSTAAAEQTAEQRLGFTARRAAILATVVCVLTLTIAGPVRTYFAQRADAKQLAMIKETLQLQVNDLKQQKAKLADPAYIKAQARERLGYVMPGETPYQVQVPATADAPAQPGAAAEAGTTTGPWYSALWHTIVDAPVGPSIPAPPGG